MADSPMTLREKAGHRIARALLELPGPLQSWLSGRTPGSRNGVALHPELRLFLAFRRLQGAPGFCDLPPAESRRRIRREALVHAGQLVPVASVRDVQISGVRARHYGPESGDRRPLLVYFHGGGYVLGDLDTHDGLCRMLCRHAGVHVLSVDYRLAPENPFPAAFDDASTAMRWALTNGASLGADPSCVAVGGDSTGGNLSAVVAQDVAGLAAQLLIYPMIDRTVDRSSLGEFGSGFLLTRGDIAYFKAHYGAPDGDPRVNPLRANSLAGLPPALIVTAGFDPLRDEGEEYAEALRAAGNRVVLQRFDGFVHMFASLIGVSPACRAAVVEIAHRLGRLLTHGAAA